VSLVDASGCDEGAAVGAGVLAERVVMGRGWRSIANGVIGVVRQGLTCGAGVVRFWEVVSVRTDVVGLCPSLTLRAVMRGAVDVGQRRGGVTGGGRSIASEMIGVVRHGLTYGADGEVWQGLAVGAGGLMGAVRWFGWSFALLIETVDDATHGCDVVCWNSG
jgi:hypothetical protein